MLATAEPAAKAAAARAVGAAWRAGGLRALGTVPPPARPARPARPVLTAPGGVPRRRITRGIAGRAALLHALAHIELNAIDLACDIVARFANPALPRDFYGDWLAVASEEAGHYTALACRLGELGATYGDLAAHDGLWESAAATAPAISRRGSPWCRWCWRRAAST